MKLAILAVGIPGSGKTTTLTPLAEQYGLKRISRDDIRIEWFGSPHLQERKDEVRQEADRRMAVALQGGTSVILDSIFIDPGQRIERIAEARAAGAERIIGIIFTTSVEEARVRNRMRELSVNEQVLEKMHAKLASSPPLESEGFDALYQSDQLDELISRELAH